jgi:hypothetical protein
MGAPRFMLHDLRKLVATVGERLGLGDAVLCRILNHTAPKTDVLHLHYVELNEGDVARALVQIQDTVSGLMHNVSHRLNLTHQLQQSYSKDDNEQICQLIPKDIFIVKSSLKQQ